MRLTIRPVQDSAALPITRTPIQEARGFPPELLAKSGHRLGTVAILYASAYTLLQVISIVLRHEPVGFTVSMVAYGFAVIISLGMFVLSRLPLDPRVLLNWGLAYMVLGALGIVLDDFWGPMGENLGPAEITWVCVWIVGFPLLVPSSPRKVLYASLTAASMAPLSLIAAFLAGRQPHVPWLMAVITFLPNYLCAGLAALGARVIYSLGSDVTKAQLMGSYHLERPLGTGGMGEVWLAHHAMLAFPAAIKLIRPDLLARVSKKDTTILRRFIREAEVTVTLGSPHSIRIFDFGVTSDGTFFYVMELLQGMDLQTMVQSHGPLPSERAIFVLKQVCHSLNDAHHKGLIHRDIKPANVYLCRLGQDDDFVKVLDFGLVVSLEDDQTHLTSPGDVPGTPAFMAPEMVLKKDEIDSRVDLYAVGCLAYWLVTGEYVFKQDTGMKTILDHVHTPPIPPSIRCGRPLWPELEDLILACLEKDPFRRPQSAGEVMRRLVALESRGTWTAEQAREWWEAHPLPGHDVAHTGSTLQANPSIIKPAP